MPTERGKGRERQRWEGRDWERDRDRDGDRDRELGPIPCHSFGTRHDHAFVLCAHLETLSQCEGLTQRRHPQRSLEPQKKRRQALWGDDYGTLVKERLWETILVQGTPSSAVEGCPDFFPHLNTLPFQPRPSI